MDALEFLREHQRMCDTQLNSGESCKGCKLGEIINRGTVCSVWCFKNPEKAIEVVEQWSKEHPRKTRQSVLLEQWPNCMMNGDGVVRMCPRNVDRMYVCDLSNSVECPDCRRKFWMQEVE